MAQINVLRLGRYEFAIETASFRHITASWSGPGWDFVFAGPCTNDDPEDSVFAHGAKLWTECGPIPLKKAADYTGVEIYLPLQYDDESGEALFDFNVGEAHDVSEVRLKFVRREGARYLIEITGMAAATVLGQPAPFELSAWTEELPDHSYLKP